MTDLTKLSDADLLALRSGDLSKVSDDGLRMMAAQAAPEKQPAPEVPFEDPGFGQTLLIGAGRTFDRIGKGAQQMYYGATGDKKALADLKARAESDDAAYAPLRKARPFATGIGESLPSLALPGGGAATLWGNVARMGAAGAIPGMLEYGSIDDRLTRGATGFAAGASIPVLGAAWKTGKAFAEPLYKSGREQVIGRVLNQVGGDDAAAIASRLRSAAPLVPGSMPTAAQVAESGGIAALERAAAQANPQAYTTRAMEQSSARLNALRGIAKDDAAMAGAEAARKAASGPLFQQATKAVYTVDEKLAGLMKRPAVQQAMARAKTLAENEGRTFSFNVSPSNPFSGLGIKDNKSTQITGQALQDLKMAMDEMLSDPASGFVGKSGDAVRSLRGQLLGWMEEANPVFKQARTTHAQMSKPINQMQVGNYLLDKVQPALSDFGALGQESGAQYARALRNADQTVRTATQFKGNKTLSDVMTPDQMGTLSAIGQDLARKANAQNLGRGVGSDTFQKLSMNNIAQQSGMPRLAGGLLEFPGIARATRWIYQGADEKAQGLLSDALLDPKQAADLMQKVSEQGLLKNSPKTRKVIEQSLLRSGLLGVPYVGATVE